MLIVYIVLFVVAELLRPKPDLQDAKPPGLGDFRFPTATEGRPIPLLWGQVRIEGPNVVWYGNLRMIPRTESVKTGMFSRKRIIIGYKYLIGIQEAFCMGPVDELTKVWVGDDLLVDRTGTPVTDGQSFAFSSLSLFGGDDLGNGGVSGELQFFAGSASQTVSPYLSNSNAVGAVVVGAGSNYEIDDVLEVQGGAFVVKAEVTVIAEVGGTVTEVELTKPGLYNLGLPTAGTSTVLVLPSGGTGTGCTVTLTFSDRLQQEGGVTPAYHDICYVIPLTDPTYIGNSTSLKPWKYEIARYPNGLSLTGGKERVAKGANPANVFYEILVNADWGFAVLAADIDTTNFSDAATILFDEGNGFSFLLDRGEDLAALIRRVEEQIDGMIFIDPLTSKWRIKLIRADYDILTVPELNADNIIEVKTFTRSTYEGTTNQVRVPFNQNDDNYKDTYGFAQDMANVRILGFNVSTSLTMPGVKDADLANAIAWAKLRTLSIPMSQGEFVVDRTLHGLRPGDPFGFTSEALNFTRLPMRVKAIDYGELLDGKITIEAVQDVFFAAAGVFDPNPASQWLPPGNDLVAYPTTQQIAFEAPLMLTKRDEDSSASPYTDKVWCAARLQGPEVEFQIVERNAAGAPTGAYVDAGEVVQFMFIGQLNAAVGLTTGATTTLTVIPEPDLQSSITDAFPTVLDLVELGTELLSMIYIQTSTGEGEFMLVKDSSNSGGNVQLNNVYRGVGDSVQREHSANARVFLVFVGSGPTDSTILAGNNVDLKFLPRSAVATLADGLATEISLTMANRTRRPYPPSRYDIGGVTFDETNVNLDGSGSGEDVGILIDEIDRRDYRALDEIVELAGDAALIHADFPTANTTTVKVEVRQVGGAAVATNAGISGTSTTMRKLDILAGLDTTSLPASLEFGVFQTHVHEGTSYDSRVSLDVVATIVDPLIGKFAFGNLDNGNISAPFTVATDVDHVFNLTSSFTLGAVEYRINGGSWQTLIASGGTGPGTITAAEIVVSDTIEVRHLSTDVDPQKLLDMEVSGTVEGYAVMFS